MKANTFEELEIWQHSLPITKEVYQLTKKSSFYKDFALRDQIRRAVISVSSNIAEGFEKRNNNEFLRFLKIAKGSLGEVRSQLYIAQLLEYISLSEFDELLAKTLLLSSQIGALINYLDRFKASNSQPLTRNS
jgi:four helix bundle protein